jgi:hypothetical protein
MSTKDSETYKYVCGVFKIRNKMVHENHEHGKNKQKQQEHEP